jgi:hypothetical protein
MSLILVDHEYIRIPCLSIGRLCSDVSHGRSTWFSFSPRSTPLQVFFTKVQGIHHIIRDLVAPA